MVNRSRIGLRGDLIVHEALPGSDFIDSQPYGLVWESIPISVQTTVRAIGVKKRAASFVPRLHIEGNNAVIVFVALFDETEYFWVERSSPNTRTYFKTSEALNRADLPRAVRQAHQKGRK